MTEAEQTAKAKAEAEATAKREAAEARELASVAAEYRRTGRVREGWLMSRAWPERFRKAKG